MNQLNRLKIVSACLLMAATCADLSAAPMTFAEEQQYDVPGGTPHAILVVDANGDDFPDVLSLSLWAYNEWDFSLVSVLLGKGDGSLQYHSENPTGPGTAAAFAAGDVNADGKLDLVTVGGKNHGASILLGRGDGAFIKTPTDYPVGKAGALTGVAVADVSNDGKPDIVVSDFGDSVVSVLLGWGNGKFRNKQDSPVGKGPWNVVLSDTNGDSKLDVMTPNILDSSVSFLKGRGNGTFRVKIDRHASHAYNLAVADTNGDSFTDLITGGSVLLGNGKGSFRRPVDFLTPEHADRMAVGDLDRDGTPDLAFTVGDVSNRVVSVLKGKGNGRFQSRQDLPVTFDGGPPNARPHALALADLNGDGKLDVVVGNENDPGMISVLLNTTP